MGFPEIRRLSDVAPAIKGVREIPASKKEEGGVEYTVVNYQVAIAGLFDDPVHGELRKECRGLIFDAEGTLLSRPFHKFFNIGERAETQPNKVDVSRPHVVEEKVDGSMVRPFLLGGRVRLGTRMGITEVSRLAEAAFDELSTPEQLEWIRDHLEAGRTPIFEFVSPDNRIVIKHGKADFVFLALRDNLSGEYLKPELPWPGRSVKTYEKVDDILAYVAGVRKEEGLEGYVLSFSDGFKVKVKSEWYVGIHRVKDFMSNSRNIVRLHLQDNLDDAIGVLPKEFLPDIREVSRSFSALMEAKRERLEFLVREMEDWLQDKGLTEMRAVKKAVATEFVPRSSITGKTGKSCSAILLAGP